MKLLMIAASDGRVSLLSEARGTRYIFVILATLASILAYAFINICHSYQVMATRHSKEFKIPTAFEK
jgi:hypothetical protein